MKKSDLFINSGTQLGYFLSNKKQTYLVCRQKYVWIGRGMARLSPSKFRVVNTLSAAIYKITQCNEPLMPSERRALRLKLIPVGFSGTDVWEKSIDSSKQLEYSKHLRCQLSAMFIYNLQGILGGAPIRPGWPARLPLGWSLVTKRTAKEKERNLFHMWKKLVITSRFSSKILGFLQSKSWVWLQQVRTVHFVNIHQFSRRHSLPKLLLFGRHDKLALWLSKIGQSFAIT